MFLPSSKAVGSCSTERWLVPKQAFPPVDNRSFRGVALGGGSAQW